MKRKAVPTLLIFSILFITLCLPVSASTVFPDVEKHWGKETIQWALEHNIAKGYEDGSFKPNNLVTEAEFLAMLIRAFQPEIKSDENGQWANNYYKLADQLSYPNSKEGDNRTRNREMTRVKVAELISATQGVHFRGNEAVRYMLDSGLARGNNPALLSVEGYSPKGYLTRAEAVQFIKNLLEQGKGKLLKSPLNPSDPSFLQYIPITSTMESDPSRLNVNGDPVASILGEPFYLAENIYIPVEPIVRGMGDKFMWINQPENGVIEKKDGSKISIYENKGAALLNNKSVPISKKFIADGANYKPYTPMVVNNKLFVPIDFLTEVLGYPIQTDVREAMPVVHAGELNKESQSVGDYEATPIPKPKPLPNWKPDLRFLPPADWIPPQIVSVATNDHRRNSEILDAELGFTDGRSFNPYGKNAYSNYPLSVIYLGDNSKYMYDIQFTSWYGSKTEANNSNKIPYVSRELFKMFLPHEHMKLFKIMSDGFDGRDVSQYINKPFKLEGREIKITEGSGYNGVTWVTVSIGKK
ncbi:S-layer homology domain-containing protein [Paenibacillus sp. FSL R5-0623]|uniref:S-layer homology domain-containing protein n=1 Tax=Paenibacillus sp. FSL R5-0623 TaxID=2921651 RepID=UPI0030DD51D0